MDHLKGAHKARLSISDKMSMAERLEKWRESKASTISSTSRLVSPPPSTSTSTNAPNSASKLDKKSASIDPRLAKVKDSASHRLDSKESSVAHSAKRDRTPNILSPAHKHLKDVHFMYENDSKVDTKLTYEQNIHPNVDGHLLNTAKADNQTVHKTAAAKRSTISSPHAYPTVLSPIASPREMSLAQSPRFSDRFTNGLLSPSAQTGYSPDPSLISSVRASSNKAINDKQLEDMEIFMKKYLELKKLYQLSQTELGNYKAKYTEISNRNQMAEEEISALKFLNAVQEMRIGELESNASTDHIKYHENAANKTKKHKAEILKMKQEKMEYEERANSMIQQMSEQMTALQTMAMSRIEVRDI
jgi:hypothetical protein